MSPTARRQSATATSLRSANRVPGQTALRAGFLLGCLLMVSAAAHGQVEATTTVENTSEPVQSSPALQNPAAAELALQRAIRLYRTATTLVDYQSAEQQLSAVIASQPDDALAYFFRALARAEIALDAERRLDDEFSSATTEEDRQRIRIDALPRIRETYDSLRSDLDRAFGSPLARTLEDNRATNVLRAVALARLADVIGQEDPQTGAQIYDDAATQRRLELLQRAERVVADYLAAAPPGVAAYRAEFYLAVIRFKIASTRRLNDALPPERLRLLDDVEQSFEQLADEAQARQRLGEEPNFPQAAIERELAQWRPLATFYLGLIATVRGSEAQQPDRRREQFELATDRLAEAARLDYLIAANGQPQEGAVPATQVADGESLITGTPRQQLVDGSNTGLMGDILAQYEEVQDALERAEEVRGAIQQAGQDLRITWTPGVMWDENVLLIGKNTAIPRDIGRKNDIRAANEFRMDYEVDGAYLAPNSEILSRLTIAFQGRTFNTWNGDIRTYNDGIYGGSAALQYRLLNATDDGQFGPLSIGVQYDYDYYMLGNDGFLASNRITPQLRLTTLEGRLDSIFYFRYENRGYLEVLRDERFDRDGDYISAGFLIGADVYDMTNVWGPRSWGLANDPAEGDSDFVRYWRVFGGAEWGSVSTNGDEYDYNTNLLTIGTIVPLPYGVDFDFRGDFEWQDYWQNSLVDRFRDPRQDFIQRYSLGLSRRFVLAPGLPENRRTLTFDRVTMTWRAAVSMTFDDSNVVDRLGQRIFEYDRVVYGLSVTFAFN